MMADDITIKRDAQLRAKCMDDNKEQWENDWRNITEFLLPQRGRYSGDQENKRKSSPTNIVNGVAGLALIILASGMHSGLTSPANIWFRLKTKNQNLEDSEDVKAWLYDVERTMFNHFAQTNFYQTTIPLYKEMAAFGTGALFQDEHPELGSVFWMLTVGTYSIGVGNNGRVDSIYRTFYMLARNVVERWGEDKVTQSTKDKVVKTTEGDSTSTDQFVKIHHLVYPRQDFDPEKIDNQNMPFASLYWEDGSGAEEILEESGYMEFPAHIPRWETTADDLWGQGPGMDALPDVKMLQQFAKGDVMALHQSVQPAMGKPGTMKGRLNLAPRAENVVDPGQDNRPFPLLQIPPGVLAASGDRIQALETRVREYFFNGLFVIPEEVGTKTATEVNIRQQEKLLQLGPVIGNLTNEFLDPLIDRTFSILSRRGEFPEAPGELQGQELEDEYVSPLATAQKIAQAQGIQAAVAFMANTFQATQNPDVLDVLDTDEAVAEYSEIQGVPPDMVRSDQDIDEIRQARAQAQAQAIQTQQDQMEASTAKDAATAEATIEGAQGG